MTLLRLQLVLWYATGDRDALVRQLTSGQRARLASRLKEAA